MSCSLQERADKQGKTSSLWEGADAVVVEGWGCWVWRDGGADKLCCPLTRGFYR